MISFGAEEAINLDGGGSATLVHRKHLLNRPYSDQDQPAPESRPVVTACCSIPNRNAGTDSGACLGERRHRVHERSLRRLLQQLGDVEQALVLAPVGDEVEGDGQALRA